MDLEFQRQIIKAMPDPLSFIKTMKKMRAALRKDQKFLKDSLGYTPDLIEKLYTVGHKLYEKGKYKEALEIFYELFTLDPKNYKVTFACGSCSQCLKDWYGAVTYYGYASESEKTKPEPLYFAAECCMQLGKEEAALELYKQVLPLCSDPHYKDLKERCRILIDSLAKRIKEGLPPLCLTESKTKAS